MVEEKAKSNKMKGEVENRGKKEEKDNGGREGYEE
jgi:hypothetical protein